MQEERQGLTVAQRNADKKQQCGTPNIANSVWPQAFASHWAEWV